MPQQEKIPADLCEELLYHLPSSDLLNFKRVCKDWNELISSQRFIQKHLRRSKSGCDGTLIVTQSPSGITVCGNPTGNQQTRRSIPYPPTFSLGNCEIASSHNGLFCLIRVHSKVFAIINPSTGKSEVCTTNGTDFLRRRGYWFGQHPSTGEYLFVLLTVTPGVKLVSQFSSKPASSQSTSVRMASFIWERVPILLHGALHWPCYRKIEFKPEIVVLAYDIRENKLLEILTPFELTIIFTLGVADGCLCAIVKTWRDRRFELWIMKEYGVKESWTKYCSIEGFMDCWYLSPLGFLPDGDLLLNVNNSRIIKYSFGDKTGTLLHVYQADCERNAGTSRAVLCADSLVPPSLIWGN